jgi:tetratricopeptide (TPR) repeat protein
VYLQRARAQDAEVDFRRAVELAPQDIECRLELGEFLRTGGRQNLADAETEFTRVIEQAPDDWRGWSARCVLRRDMEFGRCIRDGLEATRLNPRDARAYNFMAQAYYGLGRITEGIEAATNAVQADPNEWLAYYYRGILYMRLQDAEDERARNNPGDRTTTEARRTNLERVVSDFRSVVAVEPGDFRSWALMADALVELDRYDEARLACINALNLAPFDGEQSTIGMHNQLVRRSLLEIEGAAWAGRSPDSVAGMVRLAHFHMRRATRPRAPLSEYRESVRWLGQARAQISPQTARTESYELAAAETRLASVLLGSEYYTEMLRLAEARVSSGHFVFADDHLNLARALAGTAEQYLEARLKLVEVDDAQMQKTTSEFNALTPVQRRERADELIARCYAALEAAIKAGFKDDRLLEREECFTHMRGTAPWLEMLAALRASDVQPVADPGQPTAIAFLNHVIEGGPAWNAGLRKYDVIVEVNGAPVASTSDAMTALRAITPGSDYVVTVRRYPMRDGRLMFQTGPDGKRALDDAGTPAWRYSEQKITLKQGFLGIRLEDGALPSSLYP